MIIAGFVLTGLAALVHVYIWVLESLIWTGPRARATFGIRSDDEAQLTKALAFNQGFYNLFLALTALLGVGLVILGAVTVGLTLVFAGTGMMLAAALVLILSDRSKARAAIMQGTLPLLAVVVTAIGVALN